MLQTQNISIQYMHIVMEHISRIFHLANWNAILTKNLFPILPPLRPWQPLFYLLFLRFLTTLDTAHVGNYTAFVLWTYFTYHNVLELHTCCRIWKDLLSCESWIVPTLCIYKIFIHSTVSMDISLTSTFFILWKML